ncbi:MAG: hypothetical protein AAFR99_01580 [Cyanobacteria bacterium J06629_9]
MASSDIYISRTVAERYLEKAQYAIQGGQDELTAAAIRRRK